MFTLWAVPDGGQERGSGPAELHSTLPTTRLPPHPHQASSGASTSGRVKRFRHWSRVKWPARAASPAEPGSSAHSSSLEATNTNSCRRSLLRQTRARLQSSPSSSGESPRDGWGEGSCNYGERPTQPIPWLLPTASDTFILQPLLSVRCVNFIDEELGCVGICGFTWVLISGHGSYGNKQTNNNHSSSTYQDLNKLPPTSPTLGAEPSSRLLPSGRDTLSPAGKEPTSTGPLGSTSEEIPLVLGTGPRSGAAHARGTPVSPSATGVTNWSSGG